VPGSRPSAYGAYGAAPFCSRFADAPENDSAQRESRTEWCGTVRTVRRRAGARHRRSVSSCGSRAPNGAHARFAIALGLIAFACGREPRESSPPALRVAEVLGAEAEAGFARAFEPRPFEFPADHGPHPEFQSEWWYFTGNLDAELDEGTGRRFGYQLTFFRRALAAGEPARASRWATRQAWLAHFALTDADAAGSGRFRAFERASRGALGLAGAELAPLRVWLEIWEAASVGPDTFPLRLAAEEDGVALELELRPAKPLVLHGESGLSRKGSQSGNASFYYSATRLETSGTVRAGGASFAVRGFSWMDREWSTSALEPGQVGWDWFALQLDDGRELMLYRLRREDGSADPASSGTLVERDGRSRALAANEASVEALATWRSDASGATYPSRWRIVVPSAGLSLEVRPLVPEQELRLTFRYWEGAVEVEGLARGAKVDGRGYVELTGY